MVVAVLGQSLSAAESDQSLKARSVVVAESGDRHDQFFLIESKNQRGRGESNKRDRRHGGFLSGSHVFTSDPGGAARETFAFS